MALGAVLGKETDALSLKNGNYDAEGKRIVNIGSPVENNDAVNLGYLNNNSLDRSWFKKNLLMSFVCTPATPASQAAEMPKFPSVNRPLGIYAEAICSNLLAESEDVYITQQGRYNTQSASEYSDIDSSGFVPFYFYARDQNYINGIYSCLYWCNMYSVSNESVDNYIGLSSTDYYRGEQHSENSRLYFSTDERTIQTVLYFDISNSKNPQSSVTINMYWF